MLLLVQGLSALPSAIDSYSTEPLPAKIQQTKMLVMCQRFGDLLQPLQNDFVGDIQGIPSSCIRVLLKPYTNFDMLTFNLKGKGKGCTFKTNAL